MASSTNILNLITKRSEGSINQQQLKNCLLKEKIEKMEYDPTLKFERHKSDVRSLAVHPEGQILLSGESNGILALHSLKNLTKHKAFMSKLIEGLEPWPDRNWSIDTVQFSTIQKDEFWSSGKSKTLDHWKLQGNIRYLGNIEFRHRVFDHQMSEPTHGPTGGLIAVATGAPKVKVFDLRNRDFAFRLDGHYPRPSAVSWSPVEAHCLATAGADGCIKLWDTRYPRRCSAIFDKDNFIDDHRHHLRLRNLAHSDIVNGINFTPDGRRLVSVAMDDTIRLWDAITKKNLFMDFPLLLNGKTKKNIEIVSCGYENFIFITSANLIYIFKEDGSLVKTLKGHKLTVNQCVFNHISMSLFSGGCGGRILHFSGDLHPYPEAGLVLELKTSSQSSSSSV